MGRVIIWAHQTVWKPKMGEATDFSNRNVQRQKDGAASGRSNPWARPCGVFITIIEIIVENGAMIFPMARSSKQGEMELSHMVKTQTRYPFH